MQFVQNVAPLLLLVPAAAQGKHVAALSAPMAVLYLPGAQGVQRGWPSNCWYEPAPQGWHAAADGALPAL